MSFDCPKEKSIARDSWYVNKMHSHLQQQPPSDAGNDTGGEGNPDNTTNGDSGTSTAGGGSQTRTWYKSPPPRTGFTGCQIEDESMEVLLHQHLGGHEVTIRDQIMLDSGSTMDLFCNRELLDNI